MDRPERSSRLFKFFLPFFLLLSARQKERTGAPVLAALVFLPIGEFLVVVEHSFFQTGVHLMDGFCQNADRAWADCGSRVRRRHNILEPAPDPKDPASLTFLTSVKTMQV